MKSVAILLSVVSLVLASPAGAEPPKADARRQADAPRQLKEALRRGTADPEAIGAIVRWVLEEEPEKVAPQLAAALAELVPPARGAEDERWRTAARGLVLVFGDLLQDARDHRRRDGESVLRDLQRATTAQPRAHP